MMVDICEESGNYLSKKLDQLSQTLRENEVAALPKFIKLPTVSTKPKPANMPRAPLRVIKMSRNGFPHDFFTAPGCRSNGSPNRSPLHMRPDESQDAEDFLALTIGTPREPLSGRVMVSTPQTNLDFADKCKILSEGKELPEIDKDDSRFIFTPVFHAKKTKPISTESLAKELPKITHIPEAPKDAIMKKIKDSKYVAMLKDMPTNRDVHPPIRSSKLIRVQLEKGLKELNNTAFPDKRSSEKLRKGASPPASRRIIISSNNITFKSRIPPT